MSGKPRQIFYHVASEENLPRIVRKGVFARTHPEFPHGRHIGLWATFGDAYDYWRYLTRSYPCVILEVRVPRDWLVHLDEDPREDYIGTAYYIQRNVPPEWIRVIDFRHRKETRQANSSVTS